MNSKNSMDIISHGLWGGIAFGNKSKKKYWSAFARGIMPDLFSFGIFTTATILGLQSRVDFGKHDISQIPQYVNVLYNITHSIIIRAIVFGLLRVILRRPIKSVFARLLHILVDIPTHSIGFFATPFLWPISDFKINGISWGTPVIFWTNRGLIIIFYVLRFLLKKKILKFNFK